mgnify:FL=1
MPSEASREKLNQTTLFKGTVAELRNSAAGYFLTETDKMEEVSVK